MTCCSKIDKLFINNLYKLVISIFDYLYAFFIDRIFLEIFIVLIFFNCNCSLFSLFRAMILRFAIFIPLDF